MRIATIGCVLRAHGWWDGLGARHAGITESTSAATDVRGRGAGISGRRPHGIDGWGLRGRSCRQLCLGRPDAVRSRRGKSGAAKRAVDRLALHRNGDTEFAWRDGHRPPLGARLGERGASARRSQRGASLQDSQRRARGDRSHYAAYRRSLRHCRTETRGSRDDEGRLSDESDRWRPWRYGRGRASARGVAGRGGMGAGA